jgi:sulfur relay (sulfurtransferase) complex TusBCD TusD component (DsrE family)
MSFDTLRSDTDDTSVGNCSKEASDLIAILKQEVQGLELDGVELHVCVQCCDAHGRILKGGSDAFYALWWVASAI